MTIFWNVMHFVLVITEREYISNISKDRRFCSIYNFSLNYGIAIQLHLFWLKQVIWKNTLLASIKGMLIKMAITQLVMGHFEKLFHLHDPQNLSRQVYYFVPLKGYGSNGSRRDNGDLEHNVHQGAIP